MENKYIFTITTSIILIILLIASNTKIKQITDTSAIETVKRYKKGYLSFSFYLPLFIFPLKQRFRLYNSKKILIRNLFHEPLEQALISYYLNKDDSVLELGGNIGGASIVIDKITDKPHLVFEPCEEMVNILEENRIYNNCN